MRVSYSKYRMLPEEFDWDSEDEELEDLGEEMMKRDWDRFVKQEFMFGYFIIYNIIC